MDNAKTIWCIRTEPNMYCYARKVFRVQPDLAKASLSIFADSRYNCWINGSYVGQGPTPFRKPYIYYDCFDISELLQPGQNIIAVLCAYHGIPHCTYTTGQPGILAQIELLNVGGSSAFINTDHSWKAVDSSAFESHVPRRNGATAWMESFNASKEPLGWQHTNFDDSTWPDAQVITLESLNLMPRIVPYLKEYSVNSANIIGSWNVQNPVPTLEDLTRQMDQEKITPCNCESIFPFAIAADSLGFSFAVDFGQEIVGQIEIEVDAPEGITIDLCAAETLQNDGRPWCFRKNTRYAKRYKTRKGLQFWRAFGYDGFRYIYVVIRGPHPALTFHRLGAWRRETSLPLRAAFDCDNPAVNRIWDVTCHSMRVGSQDIHVDCPTREQTSAWGDHIWSGLWELYMTGNSSHLHHLLTSMEHCQRQDGQIPAYAFSGEDYPLYDYSLIAVIGIWLYVQHTGERMLPQTLLPVAEKILHWYRKRIGDSGLIELDGQKDFDAGIGQTFIDHPGLGFHTCNHMPLDRKGISAALNFFFIMALDNFAKTNAWLGNKDRARQLSNEANQIRLRSHKLFFDHVQGAYVDVVNSSIKSKSVSQQTNALAVLSETCTGDFAKRVLLRVLDSKNLKICLCGTYFWTYLSAAMCKTGLHSEMWNKVVILWDEMVRKGATSWWETFLGDDLDSLCHIWSSIPGYLILAEIVGIKPLEPGFAKIIVSPQLNLLDRVSGTMPVMEGSVSIAWTKLSRTMARIELGNCTHAEAVVELPHGWSFDLNTSYRTMILPPGKVLNGQGYKCIV